MIWRDIESKIKAGSYDNEKAEPRYMSSNTVTDSTKSVDWNYEQVSLYNKTEYPKLKKEWQENYKRLREEFKADIITAFMQTSPDITQKRAEKMYELATDYGSENYNRKFNDDYQHTSPNWFAEVWIVSHDYLADIFID